MGNLKRTFVFLTFLVAALPAPAAAIAEAIVPPGNSAVNQYTQTIPTSRGNKEVRQQGHHSPSQTLGHKAAKNLQKQGKDGQATAELASAGTPAGGGSQSGPRGGTGSGGSGASPSGGGSGGGASGASGSGPQNGQGNSGTVAAAEDGKSGVGEVLGEVTGTSSSGDLGLLLPLAIIAACVWCGAYFWRHRRTAA